MRGFVSRRSFLAASAGLTTFGLSRHITAAQGEEGNFLTAVDGEKLRVVINGENTEVRLIGVDAPEMSKGDNTSECFALDSRNYLNTVLAGQTIRLEADAENKDGKDRLWRYAWAVIDGQEVMLNEQVLALGLAVGQEENKNVKYADRLAAAAEAGKSGNLGLWATCSSPHEEIPRHGSADDPGVWGETLEAEGMQVTPSDAFLSYDYNYAQPKGGYVFLIFGAYLQNVGGGKKGYSAGRFLAKDMARDAEHKETFVLFEQPLDSGELSSGSYVFGNVAIELQEGATNLRIKYQVNAFGGPSLYWMLQL